MSNWRVWHSARSFAEYVIDHSILAYQKESIEFRQLQESDASKSGGFHKVPDHIKKILYLDAADIIIEYNSNPIICIEETKEAGTGHNAFQRFARIAAAAENGVPALYLQPEAVIIDRVSKKKGETIVNTKWDSINPLIFQAYHSVMEIFKIPALFFYYPSDYRKYKDKPEKSPNRKAHKGVKIDFDACPAEMDSEMKAFFEVVNTIIQNTIDGQPVSKLVDKIIIRERKQWLLQQYFNKQEGKEISEMSPISATVTVPTTQLLNYLKNYTDVPVEDISELLSSRPESVIYQCDASFRGDPYPGALSALDYLLCREGKSYEDRRSNLILCFGSVVQNGEEIDVQAEKDHCSINDFIAAVHRSCNKNLLTINKYSDLKPSDIGRYYMQVRYGSTYSKVKHIRVYAYFADAIIFNDGALWREA